VEIDILRPQLMPAEMVAHWRALQTADLALDSPFLTPEWPQAVERAQQNVDRGVRVAVLYETGQARGYMAVRAGSQTAMAAGAPLCDYQGLIAEPGVVFDPRQMVQALGVGRFDFSHMLAQQAPFAPYARGSDVSWIVDMDGGYEAYAAARREAGVSALKDLDKKRRKAEREAGPVTFTAYSRSKTEFDQLFSWKRAQYKATGQTDVFGPAWPMALMRDLFTGRHADFGGVLFTLHMGEHLAAAHFHLRGVHTIHAWMIAHDCQFERYSPGMLLFQDILRWMDGTPYQRLDLGQGDYRFKRELSNVQQRLSHGFVGVASPAALVRGAAYGVRAAAEALPLGKMSELPGKAMRRLDLLRGLR
jgi:CelD/BcsL family acetyltransferase involved in cellulose biosynthesis